ANQAFEEFLRIASGGEDGTLDVESVNVLAAIAIDNPDASAELQKELERNAGQTLLSTELRIKACEGEEERYFEVTLTSTSLGDEEMDAGLDLKRFVLWVRDSTEKKRRERLQRDILATTSHDLKGPLGAILTSAELLSDLESIPPDRRQQLVTRIGSCARTCVTLIDELLSARRIQDGMLVVRPRYYSVREVLEDVVLDYLQVAKAKSVTLESPPVAEGLEVYADKLALHRVLTNLINNAIKFTDAGGRIEITARRRGDEVVFRVSDTGCGIEADARPQLFERYSRLDKHASVDGTGLGLFVTKNIVDAHEGRIDIRSEVGVGTTFLVAFPDGPEPEPEETRLTRS
ncbi:MAG: HAMP domain-containing histidine kinase, partial [Bdellovibrionales bacterium]|nr:HAMP domain-containing histidine kinase [Bdellovibrionales bacterium]